MMAHSQVKMAYRPEVEERMALSAIRMAALAGRGQPAGVATAPEFKEHMPLGKVRRPDSDEDMPSGRSTPKEEAATETTRSAANSLDESSDQTPRSMSKSGDSMDLHAHTDADDEPPEDEHDDYYDFLRDFAGSFDADEEEGTDDEDEDEDAGEEEGENHDSGERRNGDQDDEHKHAAPPAELQRSTASSSEDELAGAKPAGRKRSCAFTSEEDLLGAQPAGCHRSSASSSEDELTGAHPVGRKRSSAFTSEEEIADAQPAGRKRSSTFASEEDFNRTLDSSHSLDPLTTQKSDTGSGPSNGAEDSQDDDEDTKMPPREGADDSVAAGRTPVAEEKEGLQMSQPCPEDHRDFRVGLTTPSRDHRGAVVDNYDVMLAVRNYAQQRLGDRAQQMREDVVEALRLKKAQARRLARPAGNPRSAPQIRAHYARIRHELLLQARGLEAWLVQADRALAERARQVAASGPCIAADAEIRPCSPSAAGGASRISP